jgi:hypothetical protein
VLGGAIAVELFLTDTVLDNSNKGEAGRKLEEFAESVNSSIKTMVSEREMLNNQLKVCSCCFVLRTRIV